MPLVCYKKEVQRSGFYQKSESRYEMEYNLMIVIVEAKDEKIF